jgi:hypothetical protein
VYVLEFKRTSDQRHNYRQQGERRARAQHDVLVKSLDTVAKEAKGENAGWTESKRNTIRRGFVHELLNAQDTVLCSYFAQRMGTKSDGWDRKGNGEEIFQGLERFE